ARDDPIGAVGAAAGRALAWLAIRGDDVIAVRDSHGDVRCARVALGSLRTRWKLPLFEVVGHEREVLHSGGVHRVPCNVWALNLAVDDVPRCDAVLAQRDRGVRT